MTDQIISREQIRSRARRAFSTGQSRDAHCMNPGAAALVDWLAEYDRLDSDRARDAALELRRAVRTVKKSPVSNFPDVSFKRVGTHKARI